VDEIKYSEQSSQKKNTPLSDVASNGGEGSIVCQDKI
jgi:hypothetical protein